VIEICTLVKYEDLYERMLASVARTASGFVSFSRVDDPGLPHLAEAYNDLGANSTADILLFVHDDIEFIENEWDKKIEQALETYDVAGICGMTEYNGGRLFDSGIDKAVGKIGCIVDAESAVKVFRGIYRTAPVKVVDGCFMAVKASHFKTHKFDQQFDEIFFYDMDYCLDAKCCVVDTLVSHTKPKKYYGKYPENIKPIEHYWDAFHQKHNLKPVFKTNQHCTAIRMGAYA